MAFFFVGFYLLSILIVYHFWGDVFDIELLKKLEATKYKHQYSAPKSTVAWVSCHTLNYFLVLFLFVSSFFRSSSSFFTFFVHKNPVCWVEHIQAGSSTKEQILSPTNTARNNNESNTQYLISQWPPWWPNTMEEGDMAFFLPASGCL